MPCSVSADIGSQLHEVGAAGIVSEQKDALPKPLKHRRNPGYCRRQARGNHEELSCSGEVGIAKHGSHISRSRRGCLAQRSPVQSP
jgi:hypothetical protein